MIASWDAPGDPTTYVVEHYDLTDTIAYIKKLSASGDTKVTLTHVFTKACAHGLAKNRRDIGHIQFGCFKALDTIDITVLAEVDGGQDLVPLTIKEPHKMSLLDLAKFVRDKAMETKNKKNKEHNEMMQMVNLLPSYILGPLTAIVSYLAQNV